MEKRTFEKLGINTSLLGFGAMRFPLTEEGKIDEPLSKKMIARALSSGVNYIDTAYPYHSGASEPFVGKVLKQYERSSFYLATKLPHWLIHSLEDAKRIFAEQCSRLQTEYLDFYLLHAMNGEAFDKMVSLGVVDYLEEMKTQGKIKYFGFSFHSTYEDFEKILAYKDWDFCQLQFNYMDTEEQAGERGYELARNRGIPVIVMEPVKGGSLASLPPDLDSQLKALDQKASASSFALRWVAGHSNVKVILSGMSTMEQLEDNITTFSPYEPLREDEYKTLASIRDTMKSRVGNGCTGCKYCMPCPFGVDIPGNFSIWNTYRMFQNYEGVKRNWEDKESQSKRPASCTECGRCIPLCPQHIDIPGDLKKVLQEMNISR
ncbi:aldo/keto reductase [uncultured Sphaerochaeta sp.]|uniref:aldo/keto reductase n=1 Tax=uncultured Sphaerochaeta sp. TaxID=886478 RepID=UPI002A0A5B06|nr:aldo/keto reductase [uncultured Sphaerochaeta sp.]